MLLCADVSFSWKFILNWEVLIVLRSGTVLIISDGGRCWRGCEHTKWLAINVLPWILCLCIVQLLIVFVIIPASIKLN